ncbi:MAG: tetratricopeptide repeat protein [Lutimonas sp.]
MKLLRYVLILGALSGYAQNTASDELIAASEKACQCIAGIEAGAENKNDEIQKCIKGSLVVFEDGKDVKVDRFKQVESVLVQSCAPLKELAFSENRKFKHSYSENVLAQLAYDDGMEFLQEGDVEGAIEKFKKAVSIDDQFAFAWDNLGISYRKMKRYDEAIAAYEKSLEIYDKGRLPLLNIAITYNLNEQYDESMEYYEKFIEIYSGDPEGYYGLGLIQYTQNEEEKGLDNLIHAYTIYTAQNSPYRADAAKKIGYMYKDLQNKDRLDLFHKIADKYNLKIEKN